MQRFDILIVGGGHAGAQAAIALRQLGVGGRIAIIGAEAELPYERPPLTKDYLAGTKPFARMLIRPAAFWAEQDVALIPGRRVVAVEPQARTVDTADGEMFGYGRLVWAAGGAARRLACPGADLAGVRGIRTRADVDRIAAELPGASRIVLIGGGYVGLEAAAVLVGTGRAVTLLEAQPRLLARVAGEALSRFYEAEHRAHGVDVRPGAAVVALGGHQGRVGQVLLADGSALPADLVIVGIGIEPEVAPLVAAGAAGANGVAVDEYCRTGLPHIHAIGDCAAHPGPPGSAGFRIESVQNAHDMALTAARDIAGDPLPHAAVPWFWSNQYDLRLQTVGLSAGHEAAVLRGDPSTRRFSVVYLRRGLVLALDCVNATRDYVQGRALIGRAVPPALLADADVPLKAHVAADAGAGG